MSGISCGCSLHPSACKTCSNLHPELAVHPELAKHHNFAEHQYSYPYPQTGWICPICGCGIAPNISQCSCQVKAQEEKNL